MVVGTGIWRENSTQGWWLLHAITAISKNTPLNSLLCDVYVQNQSKGVGGLFFKIFVTSEGNFKRGRVKKVLSPALLKASSLVCPPSCTEGCCWDTAGAWVCPRAAFFPAGAEAVLCSLPAPHRNVGPLRLHRGAGLLPVRLQPGCHQRPAEGTCPAGSWGGKSPQQSPGVAVALS